jgi:radical SAM protein with 4Fe4S-binding SPASM domain
VKTVHLAVTKKCNLRCKHCYSSSTDSPYANELSTEEIKTVITDIAHLGFGEIAFSGGEPLLRSDIYDLIDHAQNTGLLTSLRTNATILSLETTQWLKNAGVKKLIISIYGASSKVHDEFSRHEGSFERTKLGIRNATQAGIPFHITTCIHHQNIQDVDSILSLAENLGALSMEIENFFPVGRGKEHPELTLHPGEKKDLVDRILDHYSERNLRFRLWGIPQFSVGLVKKGRTEDKSLGCMAARTFCFISYEGTVYPCMFLRKEGGNIRRERLSDIWNGSEVFRKLRGRKLSGKCGRCEFRELCGGPRCMVWEKTGSLEKEDSDCWYY